MIILFTRDRVYTIFAGIFCLQHLRKESAAKIEFQYIPGLFLLCQSRHSLFIRA